MTSCFHCGDDCVDASIQYQEKSFCCYGCKTVFDILNDNDLSYYYDLEHSPGSSPTVNQEKFNFLENIEIANKLLEFNEGNTQIVSFLIPSIHCSSCIWVLENLNKLRSEIITSQVNFPEKKVRITFNSETFALKELVLLLSRIGYEPHISLEDALPKTKTHNNALIYKLGVAGFAFGNVMFLSFPEYFEDTEFWLEQFKPLFRWLMFAFSIPVVFYSAQDYFISAYKGLRSKLLNIDVPIAIGVAVLFIRSTIDIVFNLGSGFFDSLTGLVFFLLLGKFFQKKTYSYLSFERDYKSYFPLAVTQLLRNNNNDTIETQVEVSKISKGDRILIRNHELIPVDAILIKGKALIDYSFVTGEAEPVVKRSGDTLFAGGKQKDGNLEIEVLKSMSQSYLTQLWGNAIFKKDDTSLFQNITNKISKRFTIAVLSIAVLATSFWLIFEPSKAFNVFTAVLIVACPCAIALASPFTLGNLLRIFGYHKLYLKNATVIEKMAKIDTIVFDKTGTLTSNNKSIFHYEGVSLTSEEKELLTSALRVSNHPLSRALYEELKVNNIKTLDDFEEVIGEGISGRILENRMKIGAYNFVSKSANTVLDRKQEGTTVYISTNDNYRGSYTFQNNYREGLIELMGTLKKDYTLIVLSGDNEGERRYLEGILPTGTKIHFNQKPEDKLQFIKKLQDENQVVMMVGDGLNDAGALKQSNVGLAISENTNVFFTCL
ncbi:heavy metal translocating P-type ATPase metal-binding domain-containing protein [uncultured Algibacter sp.]|uniref:heavy metal translocating P-type ATPase n=1 Tax=uncultured Algibacter sp. TaxID=298659 RepID=UPI0032179825